MEWWRHSSTLWPVLIWKKHRIRFSTSMSCIWAPNDHSISISFRAIHSGQFWTPSASLCSGGDSRKPILLVKVVRNMTSLWRHSRLTYYDLGLNFLTQVVKLLPGEVWQVSKRNSQYFRSYLRKNHSGGLLPPSGTKVNIKCIQCWTQKAFKVAPPYVNRRIFRGSAINPLC